MATAQEATATAQEATATAQATATATAAGICDVLTNSARFVTRLRFSHFQQRILFFQTYSVTVTVTVSLKFHL